MIEVFSELETNIELTEKLIDVLDFLKPKCQDNHILRAIEQCIEVCNCLDNFLCNGIMRLNYEETYCILEKIYVAYCMVQIVLTQRSHKLVVETIWGSFEHTVVLSSETWMMFVYGYN